MLKSANLTINVSKCSLAKGPIVYLGHEAGQGKMLPLQDRIQAKVDYPVLTSKKEV